MKQIQMRKTLFGRNICNKLNERGRVLNLYLGTLLSIKTLLEIIKRSAQKRMFFSNQIIFLLSNCVEVVFFNSVREFF